jgi:hypothetical protein
MPNKGTTQNTELLLKREASLAAMSLGVGLTHIGNYSYAHTGFFYSGMFCLCIGIERVLKLIVIYDCRLRNGGRFPSNQELKRFGHKLSDLLKTAEEIADQHRLEIDKADIGDEIHKPIICFLTDFANNARYYNLDTLTGGTQLGQEPLARWDREVCTTIVARHYHLSKKSQNELDRVAELMSPLTLVRYTSDDGNPITDVHTGVRESDKVGTKQKYSKYYLYSLVRFVCDIQRELEYKGNFFPCLREFFPLFTSRDRERILKKKSWNPFPPYHF